MHHVLALARPARERGGDVAPSARQRARRRPRDARQ
jgi:hypothetical protein